ncbi:MAG: hypothetical protein EA425_06635 [Puniceicoccaceae bacterium]|nr:MAG: hypothetical protein EA425_06635 [Puniceicoccaceae bacterium]
MDDPAVLPPPHLQFLPRGVGVHRIVSDLWIADDRHFVRRGQVAKLVDLDPARHRRQPGEGLTFQPRHGETGILSRLGFGNLLRPGRAGRKEASEKKSSDDDANGLVVQMGVHGAMGLGLLGVIRLRPANPSAAIRVKEARSWITV